MKTELIPLPEHREQVYKVEGDTQDIIDTVLKAAKTKHNKQFCQFSEQISPDEQGLRKLWSFVKYKIVYQKDEDGRQDVLLPAALWFRGWGDCKSKTVFIAHVLQCLKIPYIIRFTTYLKGSNYTHVYPVALLNGKSVILDTVYDFFNREKTYTKKLDYPMTRISMISGLREPDVDKIVKEKLVVIEQQRSLITEQEPVELKGKKVGDVRALLLRRQIQLLRAFNSDDNKKLQEYNKALVTLDKAIVKGVRNYKAIGGTDTVEIAVNNLINTRLKDNRPALSFNNTFAGRVQNKIGALPEQYQRLYVEGTNDVDIRKSILRQKPDRTWVYKMGGGTPYEVPYSKIVTILNKYVVEKRYQSFNPARFRQGREIFDLNFTLSDNAFSALANYKQGSFWDTTGYNDPILKYKGKKALEDVEFSRDFLPSIYSIQAGITDYTSYKNFIDRYTNNLQREVAFPISYKYAKELIAQNPNTEYLWRQIGQLMPNSVKGTPRLGFNYKDLYNENEVTEGNNPPRAFLNFTSYDKKLAFEKYVEEQCGIWDKFLNDRLFKEDNKVGGILLYNWCDRVPNSNMSMYSNLTTSKSVIQQQYMSGVNYLTGADSTIVDDMARNTAIVGLGKNPEDTLDELLYATGKKPNIGIEPATITAIVTGIVALISFFVGLAKDTQNKAKADADDLSPEKSLGVTPVGDGLLPDIEKDFVQNQGGSGGSGGSGNNNNNTPSGSGIDTNTMLGLGIAAAGAYFLLNKKSKK